MSDPGQTTVIDVSLMAGDLLTPDERPAPSLTPQQIAQFASQFRSDMALYYPIWRQCADALAGWRTSRDINVRRNPSTSGIAEFMRSRDVSVNLIQPLFRNGTARLSTEQPSVGVVPATEHDDDIAKALASEQALRYFWRDARIKDVLRRSVEWLMLDGTAALLEYMDGDDVRVEAFSPDRIRAEPGIADEHESRFVGVTRFVTKSDLKKQFPHAEEAIDQAQPPAQWYSPSLPFLTAFPPDRVEVLEAYCKSGHWYMLVGDSGTVLAEGFTPGGCTPIQVMRYTRVPGQFFGIGMVEVCLDVQYAFSTVLNQILRNARMMSNPKVLIERSAKVDPNAFTTAVGEKVYYNGTKPDVWTPPPLPVYVQNLVPQLQSLLHDLSGIHTTSTGKRAVGISSGRAIEALTANDLAQLQSTQDDIETAVQQMARCALLYMKDYYPEEKVVRQFDQSGKSVFAALRATDLVEDPEVFIEAGTLFSAEVKDRDQKTLDLLRLGLIDPPKAKEMLSYHLDPMAPVKIIGEIQHAQKALAAVIDNGYFLEDGTPRVTIYPTDNLRVFDDVVAGMMKSDAWPMLQPDQQQAVQMLYQQILAASLPAPGEGGPGAPGGAGPGGNLPKLPQPPGAPRDPGAALMPGALDTTLEADAAVDRAEAGVL